MGAIEIETRDAVRVLRIANEPKRNCFTSAMTRSLGLALEEAEADPAVRCVVVTGAGDAAFSSGHDLHEMLAEPDGASDPSANLPFVQPGRMTTPSVAAVNGAAYAAGFILALNCDLRVCAEHATFAAPGAQIGLLPLGGQISRLPALLPRAVAHEMLIGGRRLRADEAVAMGFASRVVPRGESLAAAVALADRIAAGSPEVIQTIKRGLNTLDTEGSTAAEDFEWREARRLQDGPHAREGIAAFLEKRAPVFK